MEGNECRVVHSSQPSSSSILAAQAADAPPEDTPDDQAVLGMFHIVFFI